jgi:hypothetical protein
VDNPRSWWNNAEQLNDSTVECIMIDEFHHPHIRDQQKCCTIASLSCFDGRSGSFLDTTKNHSFNLDRFEPPMIEIERRVRLVQSKYNSEFEEDSKTVLH